MFPFNIFQLFLSKISYRALIECYKDVRDGTGSNARYHIICDSGSGDAVQ